MQNFFKTTLFLLALLLLMTACTQNVSELQKNLLVTIPKGVEAGQIDFDSDQNGQLQLSFDVRISNEHIYIIDNKQKRIQVFDYEGNPQLCIGSVKEDAEDVKGVKFQDFVFGSIGAIVSDKDGMIYVQNNLIAENSKDVKKLQKNQSQKIEMSPAYILVFNKEGKILYSLGKDGSSDVPFYSIYNMFTDDKKRLYVISKSYESWTVSRYEGRVRDFSATFDRDTFKETSENESYRGVIENIITYQSNDKLLISVAYYAKTRFKYRKIYEYHTKESRLGKAVLELPDPRNELLALLEDKYVILWDVEKKDLRFSTWNLEENIIINNQRILRNSVRPLFEKVLVDEIGRLYTMIVNESAIEVKEWK